MIKDFILIPISYRMKYIRSIEGMLAREVQNARTLTRFYAFVKWENVAK